MITAPEHVFSNAELTLLALTLDKPYFPAAELPDLDGGGRARSRGSRRDVRPLPQAGLSVVDRSAVDEIVPAILDSTASGSEPGPPSTMELGEFATAIGTAARETPEAAMEQFPEAAEFIAALVVAPRSTSIESRVPLGNDEDRHESVTFAASEELGLWLAHDEPYDSDKITRSVTRIGRDLRVRRSVTSNGFQRFSTGGRSATCWS
jgi:hypothetical protein